MAIDVDKLNGCDTLPKLLIRNYEKWGSRKIAMRVKDYGIWQEYTWKDSYQNVKLASLGMQSLGFKRGDVACIIGDNDPYWYWAEYATQSAGGIASGVFVDCVPNEIKYQIEHSGAKFIFAKDQEQIDKILDIKNLVPGLVRIIYWDDKGMASYDDPLLVSFATLLRYGKEYGESHPGGFEASVEAGKGEDIAVLCYTSGTSGLPKAAILSYKTLLGQTAAMFNISPWYETDDYMSLFAPAWITEQCFGITGALCTGAIVNFPEKPETIEQDIREVGPQFVLYTSRMWEGMSGMIQAKIDDADFIKRGIYKLFLPIGYRAATFRNSLVSHKFWDILYKLADLAVFHPLRDKLGLSRTRSCYTGGAVTSPDAFELFQAIGLDIRQIYGSSEAPLIALHRKNDIKIDTVGQVVYGWDLRITDEGEIVVKGPSLFQGYYKNDEATAKVLKDGWYHTGDAGTIDEDGHLVYIDRLTDLIELSGSQKYSPQHIEGRLKFSPYIRDAIVIGGHFGGKIQPYVIALIQIDFNIVGKWAERKHINYTTFTDLSQKSQVYDLIEREIIKVNKNLSLPAKVKKFILMHKEFDADESELTRTRKLRREFLGTKYGSMLKACYEDKNEFQAEAEVKYRDGRIGKVVTPVQIRTIS